MDKRVAYMKAYRKAHKAERIAYNKAWLKAHPGYQAAYHRARTTDRTAYFAAYHKAHRIEHADREAKRRALKAGATIEKVERVLVFERDGGRCHLCGKKVNPKHWHMDHIVPLIPCVSGEKGGEHSYQNVAVSCPKCNQRKHNKMLGQLRLF